MNEFKDPDYLALRGELGELREQLKKENLRDYFAGQALSGLLNGIEVKKTAYNKPPFQGTDNDKRNPEWLIPAAARDAYLIADAMLKAREV